MYDTYETPYERFRSLPEAVSYLKANITFNDLDIIASTMSDLECATMIQKAKPNLFKSFRP